MAKNQLAVRDVEEVIDGETGEVRALDLSSRDVLAALDRAEKAKESEFQEEMNDFWKAEKPGDALQGIYLGKIDKVRNYNFYGVARKHPKIPGKAIAMKFIASRQLSGELKKGEPGQPVRILYNGKVDHMAEDPDTGKPVKTKRHDYKVSWLPK